MVDWENLPLELLPHLYRFLSRRDRLSCSMVCERWKGGLNHAVLWKNMVVHMDTDLSEPSTLLLLRYYCKYLKKLEFGWSVPQRNYKWQIVKNKEIIKRSVRFFLILHDSFVQISHLRIFNWFDFVSFQKITYHMSRFLKNQLCLEIIIFDNINMHSAGYVKLLASCLSSRHTITTLDVRGCYYCQSSFDSVYFRSCVEQLPYLKSVKLDYYILSCKFIESILISKNRNLENLEVVLKETSWLDQIIEDQQWYHLCSACPNLKVTLFIRNVYHYGELQLYLKESIPVVSLSIALPRLLDKGGGCNFRKTLNFLVRNYHKTLEVLDLHVRNDYEILDDIVMMILRRCPNLTTFVFSGFIENPQILQKYFPNVTYLSLQQTGFSAKELGVTKILRNDIGMMRHKRVQFTLMKRNSNTTCSLLVLN